MCVASCRPPVYYPKPSGYFRIDTPTRHEYLLFDRPGFPYSFEYPANSTIMDDTVFNKEGFNKYWVNMYIKDLGGIINITYKEITKEQPLYKLVDDSWGLSYFHHEKADYIDQKATTNENGVQCMIFTIGGNAASRHQFAATDSVKHFIRGALYFDVSPNADSLRPATDFLLQDIEHMMLTLKWK
ncbi:gliding motility lipoprotein GldD [Nemorincola caseinilytica]|uniref:Gliding motility lipoprotein GldD n=1 Tax=Nemorincola caseinilytica TaxID=2054315 RepID=A0ABP8N921_9BACT